MTHANHLAPIDDGTDLYRKIFAKFVVPDENSPLGFRVSTSAFKNSTNSPEMSVVLDDTLVLCGGQARDLLSDKFPKVAAVKAAQAIGLDQAVVRSPENPADGCDAHGGIVGDKPLAVQHGFVNILRIAASL